MLAAEIHGVETEIEINQELLRASDKAQPIVCGDPGRISSIGWVAKISVTELLRSLLDSYKLSSFS